MISTSLRALQAALGDIRALSAEMVAVTPETPDHIEATAAGAAVDFPLLHDASNDFARSLGLVFTLPETLRPLFAQIGIELPARNGDATFSLPIPATYVIGRDGRLAYAFVNADFTHRAEPFDILTVLRRLPVHSLTALPSTRQPGVLRRLAAGQALGYVLRAERR